MRPTIPLGRLAASRVAATVLAATLIGVTVGPATTHAADPAPASQPAGGPLIGTIGDTAGKTPEQLGYTQAYADAKEAQRAAFDAANGPSGAMLPAATSGYLNGYAQYHQKTNAWCLSAVLQSILKFKFGSSWITPSVLNSQTYIDGQVGTSEAAALSWVNGQLAGYGVSFRYLAAAASNIETFRSYIMNDVTTFEYPTYVTVKVTHPDYVRHQSKYAEHATSAIGYGTSGALVRIADPFTSPSYSPYCNINVWPGYLSTPNIGCVYAPYEMAKYYAASLRQWW